MASPSFLPVIRTITKPDGTSLSPTDELRIMPGLTATVVTGDGPDRIELDVYVAPVNYLPPRNAVYDPGAGATADTAVVVIIAALNGPTFIPDLIFVPEGGLVADDVNYRKATAIDLSFTGTPVQIGDVVTTKTTGSGGTGDWTGGLDAFVMSLNYELPADHRLLISWEHGGSKVLPSGRWFLSP